jgi:glc operon protein GlcG
MDNDGLIEQREIGLDLAQAILASLRAVAAREGIPGALAVCDRAGNMIAFARMDGAPLGASELAINKAHTAVLWQMRSGEFQGSTQPGGDDWGLTASAGGRIVVYAGGVPVHVGDGLVGAVGMSGGTGEQDEACVLEALSANGLAG